MPPARARGAEALQQAEDGREGAGEEDDLLTAEQVVEPVGHPARHQRAAQIRRTVDEALQQVVAVGRVRGKSEDFGVEKVGAVDHGLVHALDGRAHGGRADDVDELWRSAERVVDFVVARDALFFGQKRHVVVAGRVARQLGGAGENVVVVGEVVFAGEGAAHLGDLFFGVFCEDVVDVRVGGALGVVVERRRVALVFEDAAGRHGVDAGLLLVLRFLVERRQRGVGVDVGHFERVNSWERKNNTEARASTCARPYIYVGPSGAGCTPHTTHWQGVGPCGAGGRKRFEAAGRTTAKARSETRQACSKSARTRSVVAQRSCARPTTATKLANRRGALSRGPTEPAPQRRRRSSAVAMRKAHCGWGR